MTEFVRRNPFKRKCLYTGLCLRSLKHVSTHAKILVLLEAWVFMKQVTGYFLLNIKQYETIPTDSWMSNVLIFWG